MMGGGGGAAWIAYDVATTAGRAARMHTRRADERDCSGEPTMPGRCAMRVAMPHAAIADIVSLVAPARSILSSDETLDPCMLAMHMDD